MSDFDELGTEELRALMREVIRDVLSNGLPVAEMVNLSIDEDLAAVVERRAQREITKVLSAVAGRDHVAGREP